MDIKEIFKKIWVSGGWRGFREEKCNKGIANIRGADVREELIGFGGVLCPMSTVLFIVTGSGIVNELKNEAENLPPI